MAARPLSLAPLFATQGAKCDILYQVTNKSPQNNSNLSPDYFGQYGWIMPNFWQMKDFSIRKHE
jgi:hypothetical protein